MKTMKLLQKLNTFFAFALISLNIQANNLVVNGDFSDISSTAWSGISEEPETAWNYYNGANDNTLLFQGVGVRNYWASPADLTQNILISTSGSYRFQFKYISSQLSVTPEPTYTYGVSIIGSSLNQSLVAPTGFGVIYPTSYLVNLSPGMKTIRFGNDSDESTNSPYFIITDVSLVYVGPSAADTQASLTTQARRLRSTFNSTMASGNFANMNTYDCNLFDKNNMCISAGGRYTNIDNPSSNNSAAVVTLGYKVNSNIRIGGFLDQSVNNNTPTGIQVSNKNPMMGAFAVWNQNADGLGYQVKIANAYQDKDVRSTRDAFGETGEAGTGKTNLNTQSYVGELSYAFNYKDSTIVRPYFAMRYTNIKQDAYTETGVSTPLSYAKLGDRSTTALMGVKLNHALTPRTNLTASLGIEQDIHHKTDQITASGIADLTSENFNNNIKRTRPVASAGAYYAVTKTQGLSGEVYYQQLPFQSTGSATAYVNYIIGF